MPVKKTTTAKKRATSKPPAKKTTAKKASAKEVKKPVGKRGGFHRTMNDDTGFVVGTDQDKIALALLEGGESRAAVVESVQKTLDTETKNGTPKQIPNMVSGVLNKMLANGFTVESSFVVLPPTPATKRAASRAANKKAASAPAKKTVAKKAVAKKSVSTKGKRK